VCVLSPRGSLFVIQCVHRGLCCGNVRCWHTRVRQQDLQRYTPGGRIPKRCSRWFCSIFVTLNRGKQSHRPSHKHKGASGIWGNVRLPFPCRLCRNAFHACVRSATAASASLASASGAASSATGKSFWLYAGLFFLLLLRDDDRVARCPIGCALKSNAFTREVRTLHCVECCSPLMSCSASSE
jgi:hypothetical protein